MRTRELKMAMIHRRWTDDELAMLRMLAGTLPPENIAKRIGRSRAAVMIRAHEMHLSLRRLDPDGVERNWATPCPTVGISRLSAPSLEGSSSKRSARSAY